MSTSALSQRTAQANQVAGGFLVEGQLADAIVALDRAVADPTQADETARGTCERAGIDVKDTAAVQELLQALSARMAEMSSGRQGAFLSALERFPEDQRFSLPALAEVFWQPMENLRAAGTDDVGAFRREVHRYEPQLRELFLRSSGRSLEAWEATWAALTNRLPGIFARYAAVLHRGDGSLFRRLLESPEGCGVICGAVGLLTLRMPVSTPLVTATLALVGYAGVAPVLEKLRGQLKNTLMASLADEDRVLARLGAETAPARLVDVLAELRPVLMNAVLAGEEDPDRLEEHARPYLQRLRRAATAEGGPGQAYARAASDVVTQKYIPLFSQLAVRVRASAEAPAWRRALSDPRGAGFMTAIATAPISMLAAAETPLGMWDAPLMMGLFFLAGHTVARLVASPLKELNALDQSMVAEEQLLGGLFTRSSDGPAPQH
ncbi:MAG: hypothetical protein HY904_15820 [Deltaproteobacteria bacterium]|nr:hypothetical protein [Deltaproteobacteria bacterium]